MSIDLIRAYSDIHNEFHPAFLYQIPALPDDLNTVLVLAGDIDFLKRGVTYANSMAHRFKAIIYVAGNHEYYHAKHGKFGSIQSMVTAENVHLLNNQSVTIDDTIFIGSTFWTDIPGSLIIRTSIISGLNDFNRIRWNEQHGYRKFTMDDWMKEHWTSIQYVSTTVANAPRDKKVVVVSHHAPSWKSCVYDHIEDTAYAYYSSYDPIVMDCDVWIHGHTHDCVDYTLTGGSRTGRVVANCRGYHKLIGGDTFINDGQTDRNFDHFGVGIII